MSKVVFNCRVCGFRLAREQSALQNSCPKCFQNSPYVAPSDKAAASAKAAAVAPSSAMESTSGSCSKGGPHTWKFGRCSKCSVSEGKLVAGSGTFSNPGGAGGCSDGGKHMYMFAKCKKCGASENK